MKTLTLWQNLLYRMGALLMLGGAAAFPFARLVACMAFAVGVGLYASMQVQASYEGNSLVVSRLRRQQLIGLCWLVAAAVAMGMLTWDLYQGSFLFRFVHHNEWLVLLAVGAAIQLYTAFRIPAELKRETKKNETKNCD